MSRERMHSFCVCHAMYSVSVMLCFLFLIWSFGEPPGHMELSGNI